MRTTSIFPKGILILFLLSGTCALQAQKVKSSVESRLAGVDTAIERILKDWHAAGVSVAVVEKNRVVMAKGYGYRDYEKKIPATASTLYAIGSCTKAFTSGLLGILRQQGAVDFDKPVTNYYPTLRFFNNEMTNHITLRDMMSHRTGLPRHDYSWYIFSTDSRDTLMSRIQYQEPTAGLREKWQYNNFMFMAQGAIVEKLTGKSWEENIREKLFAPVGMTHSVLTIEELEKSADAAKGYEVEKDSLVKYQKYYHIRAMGPAGSINSSVEDMAKWVITWINGGSYQGKEILSPAYVNEAIGSQMVIASAIPDKEHPDLYFATYGFGWMLSSYRGHYQVEHGGNIDGFSASTSFFPSDSVGIVVLCNQNGSVVPGLVRRLIADRILGLGYTNWTGELKKQVAKNKAHAKEAEKVLQEPGPKGPMAHAAADYCGTFENKGYGQMTVYLSKDSLLVQLPERTWWLRHNKYDIFDAFEVNPETGVDTTDKLPVFQFESNVGGQISSVKVPFEAALSPIEFNRTAKPASVVADSLKKYEGEYELQGLKAKVYLKNGKTLALQATGQGEYELTPLGADKFSIKGLNGYTIAFTVTTTNQVTDFVSMQPNGNYKFVRKK